MPKVSVLLTVYNGDKYIKESVDSILRQSLEDLELIVVDDCSTDQTPRILGSYRDPRLLVLTNSTNLRQTKSLNRALQSASGMFIARQDADDASHVERLRRQVEYLEACPDIGVLGTLTTWVNEEGVAQTTWPHVFSRADVQTTLISHCCLAHGAVMMRGEMLRELSGYDERFVESQDYDLWLRASELWELANLDMALYTYRIHEEMASIARREMVLTLGRQARDEAVGRRIRNGWIAGRQRGAQVAYGGRRIARSQLARRYSWWAEGCRLPTPEGVPTAPGRSLADFMQLAAISLVLDPGCRNTWSVFKRGILRQIKKTR